MGHVLSLTPCADLISAAKLALWRFRGLILLLRHLRLLWLQIWIDKEIDRILRVTFLFRCKLIFEVLNTHYLGLIIHCGLMACWSDWLRLLLVAPYELFNRDDTVHRVVCLIWCLIQSSWFGLGLSLKGARSEFCLLCGLFILLCRQRVIRRKLRRELVIAWVAPCMRRAVALGKSVATSMILAPAREVLASRDTVE